MLYSQLESTLKIHLKTEPSDIVFFTKLHKKRNQDVLCLRAFAVQGTSFMSPYVGHIEMTLSGKILGIYRNNIMLPIGKELRNARVDLDSIPEAYQKVVYDNEASRDNANILGQIVRGKFKAFTKENTHLFNFPQRHLGGHRGSRRRTNTAYPNYSNVLLFKAFARRFRSKNSGGKNYLYSGMKCFTLQYTLGGQYTGRLSLNQFLDYTLELKIYHATKGFILSLENEEVGEAKSIIEELLSGNISNLTKVRMATELRGISDRTIVQTGGDEILSTIRFDGMDRQPSGRYQFLFNVEEQTVKCLNGASSRVFIPKTVAKLTARLRDLG